MDREIKILIADADGSLRRLLRAALEREADMTVVGSTALGMEAAELIGSLRPDVVLLDRSLADMDVSEFIERLASIDSDSRPVVAVFSKLCADPSEDPGGEGAVDFRAFAATLRRLAHVRFAGQAEWAVDPEGRYGLYANATRILQQLGVPRHLAGYFYLREASVLTALNVNLIGAVTKELYPEVASRFQVSPTQVERAMRTVIEYTWSAGDEAMIWKYFGPSFGHKPSNSEFISVIADKLYMQKKYVELIM